MKSKILVVDDEKLLRWSLEKDLKKEGYEVLTAESAQEALRVFENYLPDVVLLDIQLKDGDGKEVLQLMRKKDPSVAVIMVTANDDVRTAVYCVKFGAFSYLSKPFEFDEIRINIEKALEGRELRKQMTQWENHEKGKYSLDSIVAKNLQMKAVLETVKQVAASEASTVLLQGESGVGKDLIARTIHYASSRASKSFVSVNCAALPETLLESELFGYEKGAFTDARQAKRGLVEEANLGTLFLDEVGDMQKELQAKLLNLIDQKKFRRVGGLTENEADIRIIAATNKDLKQEVKEGRFREDLYYRLHVIPIYIPPLRERKDDISDLVSYFVGQFNRDFKKKITEVSAEALEILNTYDWPGNVRELKNVLERAMILNMGNSILPVHIPIEIDSSLSSFSKKNPNFDLASNAIANLVGTPLEAIEKQLVCETLQKTNGNQSEAARMLKIGRDALRYKIQKYQLEGGSELRENAH